MHLRRALILFALVLGLTALAASIAPAPRNQPDAPGAAAPPPAASTTPDALTLAFAAPPPRHGGPARRVTSGRHVVVEVAAVGSGQATIPRLGRTASVTASAPARIDILAPPPGRYDVIFQPPLGAGEPVRVGTLVSRG